MGWYKLGTVSVVNGQKIVYGTGTVWSNIIFPGDTFVVDGGEVYEIDTVDADGQLTLVQDFYETTVVDGTYKIIPTSPARASSTTLVRQVSQMLTNYERVVQIEASDKFVYLDRDSGIGNAGIVMQSEGVYKKRMGTFGDDTFVIQKSDDGSNDPGAWTTIFSVSDSGVIVLPDYVTLVGVETLTNKTIVSPIITGHATIEGTTLTGKTGTGKLVLDAGATITGATLTTATIDASANTISNITTSMLAAAAFSTDGTLAGNSDTVISSQKAIKTYVDNAITGITWKPAVQIATTTNITLSGVQTLNGVTGASGLRVAVLGQTAAADNGIYVMDSGAWARAADSNTAAEIWGSAFYVEAGDNTNGGKQYANSNSTLPTLGSTNLTFSQIAGAGTYTNGAGITLTGNAFSISASAITYAMIQNVAASRLLGNPTGGAAAPSEISLGAALAFSGTALQTVAFTGDVTTSANSVATTVDKIQGVTVSGVTGTGNVVFSSAGTLTSPAIVGATNLGIRSTAASYDVIFASSEVLTANRFLSFVLGDASRTITLGGALTTTGALSTSGAFGLTLTTTALTNVTLPTTGTLSTLAGVETQTNKTFTSPAINGATIIGGTVAALTSFGVRSTGAAFDLKLASSEAITANRTLSVVTTDADRTLTMTGNLTMAGAFNLTLTTTGTTNVTLPTTGTLATRAGAETLTNKTMDFSSNTISNMALSMFAAGVIDTDGTLAANSDTRLATQKAVKTYIDAGLQGLSWKTAVACASTGNLTLSGEQTIDGVVTSASRVLVKDQTTATQNGIYVTSSGAWSRASDADTASELVWATVLVEGGVTQQRQAWTCTNATITLGVTNLVFAQTSGGTGTGAFSRTTVIATAAQTVFTVTYTVGYLEVHKNGVLLSPSEYTATSGVGVTLADACAVSDIVEFTAWNVSAVTTNLRNVTPFTATSAQTLFTVPYTVGYVEVFQNGIRLNETEFTASNGTSITLATGAKLNDTVTVVAYNAFSITMPVYTTTATYADGGTWSSAGISATSLVSTKTSNGANVEVLAVKNAGSGAGTSASVGFYAAGTKYAEIVGGYPAGPGFLFKTNSGTVMTMTDSGLGIGMTPSNILDITLSQNAGTKVVVTNANASGSASVAFRASNATANMEMYMLGTGFTTTGCWTANSGLIVSSYDMIISYGAGGGSRALIFGNSTTEIGRFTSAGMLNLTGTSTAGHQIVGTSSQGYTVIAVGGGSQWSHITAAVNGGGYNGANSAFWVGKDSGTSRSISAGGTINASGADYAEYMTKSDTCGNILKGDVIGVNTDGKLTDIFSEAHSFVIKSTDPSYVGGDTWGSVDQVGHAPVPPGDDASELEKTNYSIAKTKYTADMERLRQKVDRIAFCGQVPVNVYDALVGDYIVPAEAADGGIVGVAISSPSAEQYRSSIGRVWKLLSDGRAFVSVKVS